MAVSCSVSYDTWVSASEVDGDVEDPPGTDRPWKVSDEQRKPEFSLENEAIPTSLAKRHKLAADVESGHPRSERFTTSSKRFPAGNSPCCCEKKICTVSGITK